MAAQKLKTMFIPMNVVPKVVLPMKPAPAAASVPLAAKSKVPAVSAAVSEKVPEKVSEKVPEKKVIKVVKPAPTALASTPAAPAKVPEVAAPPAPVADTPASPAPAPAPAPVPAVAPATPAAPAVEEKKKKKSTPRVAPAGKYLANERVISAHEAKAFAGALPHTEESAQLYQFFATHLAHAKIPSSCFLNILPSMEKAAKLVRDLAEKALKAELKDGMDPDMVPLPSGHRDDESKTPFWTIAIPKESLMLLVLVIQAMITDFARLYDKFYESIAPNCSDPLEIAARMFTIQSTMDAASVPGSKSWQRKLKKIGEMHDDKIESFVQKVAHANKRKAPEADDDASAAAAGGDDDDDVIPEAKRAKRAKTVNGPKHVGGKSEDAGSGSGSGSGTGAVKVKLTKEQKEAMRAEKLAKSKAFLAEKEAHDMAEAKRVLGLRYNAYLLPLVLHALKNAKADDPKKKVMHMGVGALKTKMLNQSLDRAYATHPTMILDQKIRMAYGVELLPSTNKDGVYFHPAAILMRETLQRWDDGEGDVLAQEAEQAFKKLIHTRESSLKALRSMEAILAPIRAEQEEAKMKALAEAQAERAAFERAVGYMADSATGTPTEYVQAWTLSANLDGSGAGSGSGAGTTTMDETEDGEVQEISAPPTTPAPRTPNRPTRPAATPTTPLRAPSAPARPARPAQVSVTVPVTAPILPVPAPVPAPAASVAVAMDLSAADEDADMTAAAESALALLQQLEQEQQQTVLMDLEGGAGVDQQGDDNNAVNDKNKKKQSAQDEDVDEDGDDTSDGEDEETDDTPLKTPTADDDIEVDYE